MFRARSDAIARGALAVFLLSLLPGLATPQSPPGSGGASAPPAQVVPSSPAGLGIDTPGLVPIDGP